MKKKNEKKWREVFFTKYEVLGSVLVKRSQFRK
jgi:hypothetical protein